MRRGLGLLSITIVAPPIFGLIVTLWDIRWDFFHFGWATAPDVEVLAYQAGDHIWFVLAGLVLSLFTFLGRSWAMARLDRLACELEVVRTDILLAWLDTRAPGTRGPSSWRSRR
jgi:RsiW-degrading membrane proteinase PrsW (M82 family)